MMSLSTEIRRLGAGCLQSGLPVADGLHVEMPAQQTADVRAHVAVIISPENARTAAVGLNCDGQAIGSC